jgi:hypothetical protein
MERHGMHARRERERRAAVLVSREHGISHQLAVEEEALTTVVR